MTKDQVHAVAKGRVWSGEDALERNLVDEIGGFTDAIEKAAELAGIEEDQKVRLIYYPERKSGFEALDDIFGVSADVANAARIIGAVAGDERVAAAISQLSAAQGERAQAVSPILIEN